MPTKAQPTIVTLPQSKMAQIGNVIAFVEYDKDGNEKPGQTIGTITGMVPIPTDNDTDADDGRDAPDDLPHRKSYAFAKGFRLIQVKGRKEPNVVSVVDIIGVVDQ